MKAKITIYMNSAAFAEYPANELSRILRDLADDLEGNPMPDSHEREIAQNLRDINGNTVGTLEISP